MNAQKNLWITLVIAALALTIISCSFYIALSLYSNTIIGRDEANFVFRSTMAILSADNFSAWISALTQTHDQHVLIGMQLGNLSSYYSIGYIDFRFINVIGLVYLLIPVGLLLKSRLTAWTDTIWLAAILLPLALSPAHVSCAINAACTGNHYLGLCLAIASLYLFCASKHPLSFIAAELLLILAVFSSPAALPLVILAFPVIWLKKTSSKHQLLIHTLFSVLLIFGYYTATHSIDEPSAPISVKELLLIAAAFLNISGNIFLEPESMAAGLVTVVIGLAVVSTGSYLLWQVFQQYRKTCELPFLLLLYSSGLLLMLAMILLISIGRHHDWGSSRYIFYAAFAWIFVILLFAELHPLRFAQARPWLAGVCLAYYPLQYWLVTPYLDGLRDQITVCEKRWEEDGKACGVMIPHDEATQLLQEAYQRGLVR